MVKETKTFTNAELDALPKSEWKRIVMCTNDGGGDTNVADIDTMIGYMEYDENTPLSQIIYGLWEDTNGNMTIFIWLEDKAFKVISFEV